MVWITRTHGFDNGHRLLAVNVTACTCAICDAETEHDFALIAIEDLIDEVPHMIQRSCEALSWPEGTVIVLWQNKIQARCNLF